MLLICAVAIVALLAGAAGVRSFLQSDDRAGAMTAPISAARGGEARLPDGTIVTVPPHAVANDTTMTVRRVPTGPDAPAVAKPHGSPLKIELRDGKVLRPLTIRFPIVKPSAATTGPQTTDGWQPWAASYDEDTDSWQPITATYDEGAGVLTVRAAQFSWLSPFSWNYSWLRKVALNAFPHMGGVATGRPPSCRSEADARTQVRTSSSVGKHVQWCLGLVPVDTTVKVRNARNYPLIVQWSGPAELAAAASFDDSSAELARHLLRETRPARSNEAAMPAGSTAAIDVAPVSGDPAVMSVEFDGGMLALNIADVAVEVALAVRRLLGTPSAREDLVGAIVDGSACTSLASGAMASAETVSTFTSAATALVVDCLADLLVANRQQISGAVFETVQRLVPMAGTAVGVVVGEIDTLPAMLRGEDNYRLIAAATFDRPESAPDPQRGAVWLHDLPVDTAEYGSGLETLAKMASTSRTFRSATSQWVGCGRPATSTYRLDGAYTRLQAEIGLRENTPAGLQVSVSIRSGNTTLQKLNISTARSEPVDVDLIGRKEVTVVAEATNEELCAPDSEAYGVVGNAVVTFAQPAAMPPLTADAELSHR